MDFFPPLRTASWLHPLKSLGHLVSDPRHPCSSAWLGEPLCSWARPEELAAVVTEHAAAVARPVSAPPPPPPPPVPRSNTLCSGCRARTRRRRRPAGPITSVRTTCSRCCTDTRLLPGGQERCVGHAISRVQPCPKTPVGAPLIDDYTWGDVSCNYCILQREIWVFLYQKY